MPMFKEKLKILVINRSLKEGEKPVRDIFDVYGDKYNIIMFPPKENKNTVELIVFSRGHLFDLGRLFGIHPKYDLDDPFYDLDLDDIAEDTFYEVISQEFEIERDELTQIEK